MNSQHNRRFLVINVPNKVIKSHISRSTSWFMDGDYLTVIVCLVEIHNTLFLIKTNRIVIAILAGTDSRWSVMGCQFDDHWLSWKLIPRHWSQWILNPTNELNTLFKHFIGDETRSKRFISQLNWIKFPTIKTTTNTKLHINKINQNAS